jgi:hydrogenase nickel incorporation protein HypA/HybF
MHEFSIAQNILEVVHRTASEAGAARVARVRLKVGVFTSIHVDSLRFALEVLARGTPSEGCALEVEDVPMTVRCGACGQESRAPEILAECPACGATGVTVAGGRELSIVSIDAE